MLEMTLNGLLCFWHALSRNRTEMVQCVCWTLTFIISHSLWFCGATFVFWWLQPPWMVFIGWFLVASQSCVESCSLQNVMFHWTPNNKCVNYVMACHLPNILSYITLSRLQIPNSSKNSSVICILKAYNSVTWSEFKFDETQSKIHLPSWFDMDTICCPTYCQEILQIITFLCDNCKLVYFTFMWLWFMMCDLWFVIYYLWLTRLFTYYFTA